MKRLRLKYEMDFGILTVKEQYKMMIKNKNENIPLPDNWEIMINNYLVIKTQHKKKLEKKIGDMKKDIIDSYHILNELKKNERRKH